MSGCKGTNKSSTYMLVTLYSFPVSTNDQKETIPTLQSAQAEKEVEGSQRTGQVPWSQTIV